MTGSEKIISTIKADGDAEIAAIQSEADKRADAIMAEAAKTAQQEAAAVISDAEGKCKSIKASAKSAAELARRSALLIRRRSEIDKTISEVLSRLCSMDDAAYFDMLEQIARGFSGISGTVSMNERDLKRVPSDFTDRLKKIGVDATLSREPVNITGGFVLVSGEIEYRADFSALLEDKRDAVEDLINRELFR